MEKIVVSGGFDHLLSREVRFLQEAANFGPVYVYLWSDTVVKTMTGAAPKFPFEERKYFLEAVRYAYKVRRVAEAHHPEQNPQNLPWIISRKCHI